jgi:type II secretion system protein N
MADAAARYRILIKIGLCLYAFVCLVVFIWVRFPYDSVKYKLENVLTNVIGAQVTLGHIKPNLLWGFSADNMEIKGVPVARQITISPKPWDIFRGSLGFGFHADLLSGMTDGHMMLPFRKSKSPMDITVNMTNVDLSGLSKVFPPSLTPKGIVSGELNLTTLRSSLDKATGNLVLNWKKGTLPLGMESLPFDSLVFENLDFDGRIDKGLLNLEKVDFTGEFSGTMKGNIRFSNEVKRSRLAITGELNLPEAIKKSLGPLYDSSGQGNRFSLRGSIDRPRFRMLNMTPRRVMPIGPVVGQEQEANINSLPQPSPLEHRQTERLKPETTSPNQPPASIDRALPERKAPDEMQNETDMEPEGQ